MKCVLTAIDAAPDDIAQLRGVVHVGVTHVPKVKFATRRQVRFTRANRGRARLWLRWNRVAT